MNPIVANPPAPPEPDAPAEQPAPTPERRCASCGASLDGAQEWCLECGAGMPGALVGRPAWRSTAAIIGAAVVLAAGAVAASYAALSSDSNRDASQPVTTVTATATAPPAPAAAATPPPAATTTTPPPVTTTPPKISTTPPPATATTTPAAATTTPTPASTPATTTPANTTPTTTTTSTSTTTTSSTSTPPPSPVITPGQKILLDPDAASSYNPYGVNVTFGDPASAIDGDQTTAWTAGVDPATAPHMDVGLDINLRAPQTISKVDISTSTPGMIVQVYGTSESADPPSITDPGWIHLADSTLKAHTKVTLSRAGVKFRHVMVWIVQAPPTPAGGTAPTSVAIDELSVIS